MKDRQEIRDDMVEITEKTALNCAKTKLEHALNTAAPGVKKDLRKR